MQRRTLPSGQSWYLSRLHKINSTIPLDGACHGIVGMGMQAFLANDLDTFDNRFFTIYDLPLDVFELELSNHKSKRINTVASIKKKIATETVLTDQLFINLSQEEAIKPQLLRLEKIMEEVAIEKKLNVTKKNEEFERRKKQVVNAFYIQEQINQYTIDPLELSRLDIINFAEGVALYQSPYQHSSVFPPGKTPIIQSAIYTAPLTTSVKLDHLGGVRQIHRSYDIYTHDELLHFFNTIEQTYQKGNGRVAFLLHSRIHTIMIGYDPKEGFCYIDANNLPSKQKLSSTAVAALTNHSLSRADFATAFSYECFSTADSYTEACNLCRVFESKIAPSKVINEDKAKLKDAYGVNLLYFAAEHNDLAAVKQLQAHSDINSYCTFTGTTPLMLAAFDADFEIIKVLIENGADSDCKTFKGIDSDADADCKTFKGEAKAIHMALSANRSEEIIGYLVDNIKQIRDVDAKGNTLLIHLVSKHPAFVKKLIERGVDPSTKNLAGVNALHAACMHGNIESIKVIIEAGIAGNHTFAPIDVNTVSNEGYTALDYLFKNKHLSCIPYLLEQGANPNIIINGQSLLSATMKLGEVSLTRKLLAHGAFPNYIREDGYPLLYHAIKEKACEMVIALLDHNVELNLIFKDGFTPLTKAVKEGGTEIALALLSKGSDVNQLDTHHLSPLYYAIINQDIAMVKLLLQNGADTQVYYPNGLSPLHLAIRNGNLDIVTAVLQFTHDPNRTDEHGATPLYLAALYGYAPIVELLLEVAEPSVPFKTELTEFNIFVTKLDLHKNATLFLNRLNTTHTHQLHNQKISITPQDIAEIRGHTAVVDLFKGNRAKRKANHNFFAANAGEPQKKQHINQHKNPLK